MALIFINYRTNDASWAAGAIAARLAEHFGQKNVFLDTKSIDLGDEFPTVIREHLQEAHVLLAVIGPQWLTAQSVDGLDINDPDDWVRREIAEAIKTKKKIIPVLVDNANLARKKDLPSDLQLLADLHSLSINEKSLDDGIKRLTQKLEALVADQRGAPPSDGDRRLDLAARLLTRELHLRWKREMTTRESLRPRPLTIRWAPTKLPVTVLPRADPDNDSPPGRTVPIPPSGTVGANRD
jgi:hypothetical protein